jgi:signal transduction histidine kinase
VTQDRPFTRLVSIACHDLVTPLSTVHGFAKTLERLELETPADQYVEMIRLAGEQMRELIEQLRIAAQIEAGRYAPPLVEVDSLELAQGAAGALDEQRVIVSGEGAAVMVEPVAARRALAQLARAAARYGGHDSVDLTVRGAELAISPLGPSAAPVLLGERLDELGAPAAAILIRALGGTLAAEEERLVIRLPEPSPASPS